ncbi:MAG: DUF3052 family protein [Croceitalea sp.]|nr:DUF3052 family protein [Croceitalea sp.]MBT8237794.1 DUF3052 family protein [Croceitalea sp.]NNC34444.1 DUF3052 family protein [Croceitalea sp.]NNL09107.1 DUF3052 family protein [Croceitalea sp.]NNM17853.1 DUF3052 family protein [Croceitalea sp.]
MVWPLDSRKYWIKWKTRTPNNSRLGIEGYSKTPLVKKLGIKSGQNILLLSVPEHYFELFSGFPEGVTQLDSEAIEQADFIHLFAQNYGILKSQAQNAKRALKKTGILWVSWPKGTSSIVTDLNRELVREHLLQLGLVDTKVAAIDKDWSGLKFMYRLKDR